MDGTFSLAAPYLPSLRAFIAALPRSRYLGREDLLPDIYGTTAFFSLSGGRVEELDLVLAWAARPPPGAVRATGLHDARMVALLSLLFGFYSEDGGLEMDGVSAPDLDRWDRTVSLVGWGYREGEVVATNATLAALFLRRNDLLHPFPLPDPSFPLSPFGTSHLLRITWISTDDLTLSSLSTVLVEERGPRGPLWIGRTLDNDDEPVVIWPPLVLETLVLFSGTPPPPEGEGELLTVRYWTGTSLSGRLEGGYLRDAFRERRLFPAAAVSYSFLPGESAERLLLSGERTPHRRGFRVLVSTDRGPVFECLRGEVAGGEGNRLFLRRPSGRIVPLYLGAVVGPC